MLARHRQHARAAPRTEDLVRDPLVPPLVPGRLVGAGDDVRVGAERLEHAQAVLPDEDAGAEVPQLRGRLVDARRPAALAERRRDGETAEPRADDLGVATRHVSARETREARLRREDGHVNPDLRDDHLGRALVDPANGVETRQFVRERERRPF